MTGNMGMALPWGLSDILDDDDDVKDALVTELEAFGMLRIGVPPDTGLAPTPGAENTSN